MKKRLKAFIEMMAVALIVAGVSAWSVPAALIIFGFAALIVIWQTEVKE